jgi:PAS domain S-box-containing protein
LPWAGALEEAARSGEYRFRTVFESNLAPLSFWHVDGRILDANEAFLQLVGYSRDELEAGGLRWDSLTAPEYRDLCRQSVEEALRGKASTLIEKEYLLRDGRRIPVIVKAALLPGSSDCGVAVVLDISRRRQTERELSQKEEQYLSIFNAAQDGFIITDWQGSIVEANPQACRMHGYSCDEFVGLDSRKLIHPDYHHLFAQFVEDIEKNGQHRNEALGVRRDGSTFPVEIVASLLLHQGQPHILGVVRDITERRQTQEKLRYQSSLTEVITNNTIEALFLMDARGRVTYMNPAAEKTFGWTAKELTGLVLHEALHYKHRDGRPHPVEECPLGGVFRFGQTVHAHEDWFLHKDGSFIPVLCSNAPILADGRAVGAVLVVHDITVRKRVEEERLKAEAALVQTEERLRLATEAAAIGTWDYDLVTGILNWSERSKAMFGISPRQDVTYQLFLESLHPQDRERVDSAVQQCIDPESSGEYDIEFRVLWPNGTLRWIAARGRVIFDSESGTRRGVRFVGTVIDITEHKREGERDRLLSSASVELSASLDYETTLHRIADLAVPVLADCCIVDLLEEDGTLRQIAVAHVVPEKAELVRELRRLNPHDPDRTVGVAQVMRTGTPELVREVTRTVHETYIHDNRSAQITHELGVVSYMIVPMRARGRNIGTLALCAAESGQHYDENDSRFAIDLAERAAIAVDNARLFRQAQQARREAEAANRGKDEFLATLSHELRTPLNAMLGWANLLNSGKLDADDARRAGEVIERNVRVQAQLLNDLFDVSRIITGKLSLETQPLDLLPFIEAASDSVLASMQAKSIEFEIVAEARNLVVAGDSTRLQQVLWNLLSNAVRFTPVGGRIEVRLAREAREAVISVVDSGQGIEPEFLPFVFDRFRQADSSSTRRHGGMGLGLAIVRHLTEMHGGNVNAQSRGLGHGATFIVRLPLLHSRDEDSGTGNSRRRRDTLEMPQPLFHQLRSDTLRGLQILVVEDEDDTRELITDVLGRYGAGVRAANSAAAAFELLQSWRPDVLVSDIAMPDEDGYSFIRRVRTLPPERGGDLPAIAVTAMAGAADRRAALASGYQEHLSKPIDPTTLIVTIAALLGRM